MYTIIVQQTIDTTETYTTKSLTKAYAIYDNAIKHGYLVLSFTDKNGKNIADR